MLDDAGLRVVPRRQGMLLPDSTALVRIAVVRIEAASGMPLNAAQADAVALAVSDATADDATVAALQVDFDARQSQREWYAGVLRRVPERRPRIRVPLNPVFHCT
jgi:hypothetical protein